MDTRIVHLDHTPLQPGRGPTSIHCRRIGRGFPLLFLHGGWGYEIYSFDVAASTLGCFFSILIPDRTGYGGSTHVERFMQPLHQAGAMETVALLDAVGIEGRALWGHSDGAVMAANVALLAPERVAAVILEATHLDRRKAASRPFFEELASGRLDAGRRAAAALRRDHGEDYWRRVLAMHGQAWMEILETAGDPAADLYGGRLESIKTPVLLLHGGKDPRTEPGELERLRCCIPHAELALFPDAGHSPHSEAGVAGPCIAQAQQFLRSHTSGGGVRTYRSPRDSSLRSE